MTRAPGFYWLRAEDGTWTVGECEDDGAWSVMADDSRFTEMFGDCIRYKAFEYEIGPRVEAPGDEVVR